MDKKAEVSGALARGYCTKRNSKKVLDPDLIEDMATEVIALFPEPSVEEIENVLWETLLSKVVWKTGGKLNG